MFDILFARTFIIVWVMLLITAYATYINKKAKPVGWPLIVIMFILLFVINIYWGIYPINLLLVWLFALIMWWIIAPSIKSIWNNIKTKKFMKEKGIVLGKDEVLSDSQLNDLDEYLLSHHSNDEWNKIVGQAMFSTALSVLITASIVFLTSIDFSFIWIFLFIALIILIIMWLMNIFVFKSKIFSLIKAYFWVIVFTWYLIYDFNNLEKIAWDDSWSAAINLSVNIYLDIINLFLYLLQIFSWWDN